MEIFTLKKTTSGMVLAAIVGSLIAWFNLDDPSIDDRQIIDSSPEFVNNKKNTDNVKRINAEKFIVKKDNCQSSDTPLFANKPIKSLGNIEERAQRVLAAGSYNPKNLIENARKGDPISALAVFSLFQSCFPNGEIAMLSDSSERKIGNRALEFCGNFPEHVRSDPLSLLEVAATNGSAEAKLAYAMNAEQITKLAIFHAKTDAPADAVKIMKKAELFGISAASEGVEEAYWFMARAYQMGTFREPDPILAYAYTLPITMMNQSSELTERLDFLDKNLSSTQIRQAQSMAFGCHNIYNSNLFVSPF
jgi:hypothetical protein